MLGAGAGGQAVGIPVIAVAPVSSAQNFRTNAIIGGRCAPTYEPPVNIDRESSRSAAILA
jgi:hypothetical protein